MNFTDLTILITVFEIITFFLVIKNYFKLKGTTEDYFLIFLAYTVITELLGFYSAYILKTNWNVIYNIYAIISYAFYFFWFYRILKSKKQKKILLMLGSAFLVLAIYGFLKLYLHNYHILTFIVGAIINIIASIFFFTQLLNDKEEIEVIHNLKFWISTGILLFNVGMVPFMLFSKEFSASSYTRTVILVILNFMLYGCYSLGFILCRRPTEN